ncbi:MAG TPA: hypothetical protein VND89_03230 [Acidimicrobiales bacterium]|nr:hypothetical protein [Acidimicrobiales bacterium]
MSDVRTLAIDFTGIARRRRRRRAIIAVAVGVTFLASSGYWLDNSGVLGTTITPLAGASPTGSVATVSWSSLTGQVTSGGVLTVGVPVSRIVVAKSYLNNTTTGQNIRIDLAWTNASTSVLHGNDIVALGLWYPVSTTTSSGSCGATGALFVADTDTQATTTVGAGGGVCALPDTAATGGLNVDTSTVTSDLQRGMLILSKASIGGYLMPGKAPPSTIGVCLPDAGQSTWAWCQPPGVGDQGTATIPITNATLYVLAQVVNNGGQVPPGQQVVPGTFNFFTSVKAIS